MPSRRIARVNEQVRALFAQLIERELSLKQGVIVTVVKADTTADLQHSKISLSIYPEGEEGYAITAVKNHLSDLQKKLHRNLTMKIRPHIHILSDHTESKASEIELLLKQISEE